MSLNDLPLELLREIADQLPRPSFLKLRLLNSSFEHRLRRDFETQFCKTAFVIPGKKASLNKLAARSNSRFSGLVEAINISTQHEKSPISPKELIEALWLIRSGYSTTRLASTLPRFVNCKTICLGGFELYRSEPLEVPFMSQIESQEHSSGVVWDAVAALDISGLEVRSLTIASSTLGPLYPLSLPIPDPKVFNKVQRLSLLLEPMWSDFCGTKVLCNFLGLFDHVRALDVRFTSYADEYLSAELLRQVGNMEPSELRLDHLACERQVLVETVRKCACSLRTMTLRAVHLQGDMTNWLDVLNEVRRAPELQRLTLQDCTSTDGAQFHQFDSGVGAAASTLCDFTDALTEQYDIIHSATR